MAYDKLVDSSQLNSDLEDVADAIRAKSGGSSQLAFPQGFVSEIGNIQTGAQITQGVIVKAVNASGYPTEVDIYGNVPPYCFGYYSLGSGASFGAYLTKVNFKTNLTEIGSGAFQRTQIESISIPDSVTTMGNQLFRYNNTSNCTLKHFIHENASNMYTYSGGAKSAIAYSFGKLEDAQFGAVGKPMTGYYYQCFQNSYAPSTAVFTIYTTGDNVDNFLTEMRRSLTSQKIIFKASGSTTYNGNSFAAGETMLTSEVTS